MTDHYAQTSLLLPMNGANNGTEFTDWSPVPKTVTRSGVVTSTAQSKFYGSSGFFGGTDDILSVPHSSDLDIFEFPAFTVGGWIYLRTVKRMGIINKRPTSVPQGWAIRVDGTTGYLRLQSIGVASVPSTTALSAATWQHFEAGWDGTTGYVFLDGALSNSGPVAKPTANPTGVTIGAEEGAASNLFDGYMQDLEIISGVCLHTANFTPPPRLIGTISNTNGDPITDENGVPAQRKIFAVPRSYFGAGGVGGVGPIWSTESDADGRYELWAPAGVEHLRIIVAQDSGSPGPADPVLPDLIDRVIPA